MSYILSIGEILLRLSTEKGKTVRNSDYLNISFGGAEANVVHNLARFGHLCSFLTALPFNEVGRAAEDHLIRSNIDVSRITWADKTERMGSYYIESAASLRPAKVIYDRKYSAFSLDDNLFDDPDTRLQDVQLIHISGITLSIFVKQIDAVFAFLDRAKELGIKVSFDINYRSTMWGYDVARPILRKMMTYVDYCSAGTLDAKYLFECVENTTRKDDKLFYFEKMAEMFPNVKVFYSSTRETTNYGYRYQGNLFTDGKLFISPIFEVPSPVDRVGTGDALSSGFLHGILKGWQNQDVINFAASSAVMKHSYIGDWNLASEEEIANLITNGMTDVVR